MATLIDSIITTLKADAPTIALTANGANSIYRSGTFSPSDQTLAVIVRGGSILSPVRARPHVEIAVEIQVHDRPVARNAADFYLIDQLLNTIRTKLDGLASLNADDDNMTVFYSVWDSVRSPDWYDPIAETWYHWDRYRVFCSMKSHYHA